MKCLAIISQHFFPSQASTAQLITDLALGLNLQGHTVQIFTDTPVNRSPSLSSEKLTIHHSRTSIREGHSILNKVFCSLFFLINGFWYILFHVPANVPLLIASNPPYAGILGICFKYLKGGQYTFLLQDVFPESAVLSGVFSSKSLPYRFFDYLMAVICQQAQQTIVLTSSMQAYLARKNPTLESKLHVIENWAIEAIEPRPKNDNPFAQEYGLDKTFTILYSGNIGRLHEIETIVEAIYLLRNDPIQFVFIGDGPKKPLLEEYIQKYQLQNLLLLPFQPRQQLSNTLTACDISLVSLIPGAENIVAPCKFYGMLAAGRAIISISTPDSYLAQLLSEFDCGINCPPGDPQTLANTIRKLSTQPDQIAILAANAHQLYQTQYRVERAIQEYEALLLSQNSQDR